MTFSLFVLLITVAFQSSTHHLCYCWVSALDG